MSLHSSHGMHSSGDVWSKGGVQPIRAEQPGPSADPFGGDDPEAFLSRLRQRMRRSDPPSAYPGSSVWPPGHENSWSFEQKAEIFTKSLQAIGGRVLRAKHERDAYRLIRDALLERGVKGVLTSGGDWGVCRSVLGEAGIGVEAWDEVAFGHGEADRDIARADRWGAGLAWADFAVADTGGIAVVSSPQQGRSVSLVPPIFVALVAPEALVYSRRTVLERIAEAGREKGVPSALTFITGPSRSADIENDLSIGVHGPGEVIAVLLESR